MRAAWLAALVLVAGCGSTATDRPAPSAPEPKMLTYQQVVAGACVGHRIEREAEPEMFTRASANCGPAGVAIFAGPQAREGWLSFAAGQPVLAGPNWAVWIDSFNPRPAYRKIQARIGGKVITP